MIAEAVRHPCNAEWQVLHQMALSVRLNKSHSVLGTSSLVLMCNLSKPGFWSEDWTSAMTEPLFQVWSLDCFTYRNRCWTALFPRLHLSLELVSLLVILSFLSCNSLSLVTSSSEVVPDPGTWCMLLEYQRSVESCCLPASLLESIGIFFCFITHTYSCSSTSVALCCCPLHCHCCSPSDLVRNLSVNLYLAPHWKLLCMLYTFSIVKQQFSL